MEYNIAGTKTYYEKGSINTRVGIGTKVGIKANFSKDIFRLS